MSDDLLFQEVDEDVRQEQYKKLWQRYGNYLMALCVAVVVAVAGFKGWEYWQVRQAEAAADIFLDAEKLVQTDKAEDALARFAAVNHRGYGQLARLREAASPLSVLRDCFPGGSITGAPKLRAMEIIDELEPVKRGVYAGAVGYLGFNGDMDVAIALRTAVIKDGMLHVQAGGGVVADSVPEAEWQETQNKAKALLRAAEIAESGLDSRID